MRILIAEDDLTSRLMLQAVLGKFGYDVTIAKDGEEAWKILQHPDAPKLIVLDRIMPGMDGLTLCRNLRAQHHPEPFYILLLTSKAESNDIVQGLEAGAVLFLNRLKCKIQFVVSTTSHLSCFTNTDLTLSY